MLTTIEASKKWNISTRRIAKLASEGRIPGAKLLGHNWLIPEDAAKPADARAKDYNEERFVYPNILCSMCNKYTYEDLNTEEKELYAIFMKYEHGDFESGLTDAQNLLSKTDNTFIKLGAMYSICFFNIILRRYNETQSSILSFIAFCRNIKTHPTEMTLLMNDIFFFFEKNENFKTKINIESNLNYSNFVLAYLSCQNIIQEIFELKENISINFNMHELNIVRLKNDGYEYMTMFYHFYISILYAWKQKPKEEYYHIQEAINLAVKNNTYTSIAGVMCIFPDLVYKALEKYPKAVKNKFINLIELSSETFTEYQGYTKNKIQLSRLTIDDFKLFSYSIRGMTINEIAQSENTSSSKIKHKFVELYEKLGITKKSDIKEQFSSFLI